MATLVVDIAAQVVAHLNDKAYKSWDATDVYGWIYQAEKAVGIIKPDAISITAQLDLVPGSKQSIPAGALRLLNLHYNVNAGGTVPGRSVDKKDLRKLDAYNPDWRSSTPSNSIKEFDFDLDDPTVFWVNPPASSDAHVVGVYTMTPAPYGTVDGTTTISIKDIYEPALVARACYLALSGDNEGTPNFAKAQDFKQEFYMLLGAKEQAEAKIEESR
jgi:hypothetical protein